MENKKHIESEYEYRQRMNKYTNAMIQFSENFSIAKTNFSDIDIATLLIERKYAAVLEVLNITNSAIVNCFIAMTILDEMSKDKDIEKRRKEIDRQIRLL